ncbi:hypothetical protein [Roseospira visakhapatnamensis]|uniref:Uncharacterized protein n=1 Tax=Roseospira visakhapatnamensis TaxID=390880 RepID=A0A7W6R9M6_9PROT|nr:hypothetical protein [Roseospira visakhapatnamensis]MBB4264427.1 hypothetical protein [Roseospira visakhapatnamensis]
MEKAVTGIKESNFWRIFKSFLALISIFIILSLLIIVSHYAIIEYTFERSIILTRSKAVFSVEALVHSVNNAINFHLLVMFGLYAMMYYAFGRIALKNNVHVSLGKKIILAVFFFVSFFFFYIGYKIEQELMYQVFLHSFDWKMIYPYFDLMATCLAINAGLCAYLTFDMVSLSTGKGEADHEEPRITESRTLANQRDRTLGTSSALRPEDDSVSSRGAVESRPGPDISPADDDSGATGPSQRHGGVRSGVPAESGHGHAG